MSKLYDQVGGFVTVPNTVIKLIPVIQEDAFTLWAYLRYRTNSESGVAFPSYDVIRKEIGMSYRRIAKSLRKLEENDLIERHKRFGNSTEYFLKAPIPNTVDRTVLSPLRGKSYHRRETINTDTINTDTIKSSDNSSLGDEIEFVTPEQTKKRTPQQAKDEIAESMRQSNVEKAGIADARKGRNRDVAGVAAGLASVKYQKAEMPEAYLDDKNASSYPARKAAERLIASALSEGKGLSEIEQACAHFMDVRYNEKYARFDCSFDTIANDIVSFWKKQKDQVVSLDEQNARLIAEYRAGKKKFVDEMNE